jgi:hypothetical protein
VPFTVDALLIRELLLKDLVEERILHLLVMLDQFLPFFEKLSYSIILLANIAWDFKCFSQFLLYLLGFLFALLSCEIKPAKLHSDVSPCFHQFVEVILLPLCGHLHFGDLVMQPLLFKGALVKCLVEFLHHFTHVIL